MRFALFGINDDVLNLVVNLLILSLVVVYFALVAWTFFDARRRMADPVLVAASVGASFVFPFIGTVIYSILRPPEFLEDAHERQVEIKAAELRVKQLTEQSCPRCEYPVEKNYLRCPNCRARLKDPCPSCGRPVDPRWALCPYCETVLERAKARSKREPERRAARREGPRPAPDARPSQARSGRGGRRAAAGASRGSSSKQTSSQAEGQRRKASAGSRRQPARAGSGDKSEQDTQESGLPGGEERPRPATAS